MSLLSLVAALLLEQWRPLADRRYLYALLARYATFLEGLFNAGETRQGAIAWVIAVLPAVLGPGSSTRPRMVHTLSSRSCSTSLRSISRWDFVSAATISPPFISP